MSDGRIGILLCVIGLAVIVSPTLLESVRSRSTDTPPTDRSATVVTTIALPNPLPTDVVIIHPTTGGLVRVRVAIADTAAKQEAGLAGRSSLAPDEGMLFAFGQPGRPQFWMRDVSIPLSIAFFAADGTIIDVRDLNPRDDRLQIPFGRRRPRPRSAPWLLRTNRRSHRRPT